MTISVLLLNFEILVRLVYLFLTENRNICFWFSLARRIREKTEVEIENEEEGNKLLMEYIPEMARPLLMQFIGKTLNEAQMLATANLFYQLSFDVAVTALVPRKMIPFVEEMFECGRQQDTVGLKRAIEQSFSISKHLRMCCSTKFIF